MGVLREHEQSNWPMKVMRRPSPIEVARLSQSHGWDACFERWDYLGSRTLAKLAMEGRRQLATVGSRRR